jgi:tetratricopeptide (TPR) repeat protein
MTANNRSVLVSDLIHLRAIVEPHFSGHDIRSIHLLRPLAALYVESGSLDEALELQRRIYSLSLKFSGNVNLPSVADARKALAATLQGLKLYDEAVPLLQSAVGEGDGSAASALVVCLQNVGRFDEAIALCQAMVARFEQQSDEKSFGTHVSWLMNLSRCYSCQQNYAAAAQVCERTIPLMAARAEVLCIPQLDVLAELYRQAGNTAEYDRVRAKRREIADRCDY